MKKIIEHKWQIVALALIGAAFVAQGGIISLGPILRFFVPFIVLVLIWKFIKYKLIKLAQAKVGNNFADIMKKMQEAQRNANQTNFNSSNNYKKHNEQSSRNAKHHKSDDTLDLCPKCSAVLTPSHRC